MHTHKHTCIQAEAHADIHTYIKIDTGTNKYTHIHTDRHTDIGTNALTYTHMNIYTHRDRHSYIHI